MSVPATSSLVGVNGISLSTNGSTISISAVPVTFSYFNPQDAYVQVTGQQGQSTLHIQPAKFPNVQFDRIVIPMVNTNSSNSSGSHSISFRIGIYTNNAGTLSLVTSTSSSTAVTHSGTAGSYSLFWCSSVHHPDHNDHHGRPILDRSSLNDDFRWNERIVLTDPR